MTIAGMKIRLLRTLLEMNQAQFADVVNITQPELSDVETGTRVANSRIIERVETALGVSLDDPAIEDFVSLKIVIETKPEIALAA